MASEQIRKRLSNQGLILECLRLNGPSQRTDLSVNLDLRKSSVTNICRDLIDRNILTETEKGAYRSPVTLSSQYWKVGAIHLYSGSINTALVNIDGSITHEESSTFAPTDTPEEILSRAAIQLADSFGDNEVIGVGVSIPGITDPSRGHSIAAVNLPNWREVPVRELLSNALPSPPLGITVQNDATCELIANTWFTPFGQDLNSALYLSIGKGIGCAQIMNGTPLHGHHFAVGEIGCLPSGSEGRPCSCGKADCLQTYCSTPALTAEMVKQHPELASKSLVEICALASADTKLSQSLATALTPLAEKTATMIALTDPDGLVLASPDPAITLTLAPLLTAALHERLSGLYASDITVYPGIPCYQASLLGAATTAFQSTFETQDVVVPG